MSRTPNVGLDQHQKEFVKLTEANARRFRKHEVFRDFCEMSALAFSNRVDLRQYDEREARYLAIAKNYDRAELERFAHMLACLTNSLEDRFHDALGQLFMALELGDHWKGQYFTPYSVSHMMAEISFNDVEQIIEKKGFCQVNEPTAGAGGMVIAAAQTLRDKGLNYQKLMHVIAQDIDQTAVHMTYLQLSLLHVPAVVIHGNSLWPEQTWGQWFTPAHVMGLWDVRLRNHERGTGAGQPASPVEFLPPAAPLPAEIIAEAVPAPAPHRPIARTNQLDLF